MESRLFGFTMGLLILAGYASGRLSSCATRQVLDKYERGDCRCVIRPRNVVQDLVISAKFMSIWPDTKFWSSEPLLRLINSLNTETCD